ncbi:MAG: caspase family protein [Hydrogenothermaceae bacterium]
MKKLISFLLVISLIQTSKSFQIDGELSKISEALEKIGVDCGTVQDRDNGKYRCIEKDSKTGVLRLKGEYKDYDQFLSAYMIVQSIVGVNRVSPVFDTFDTNIRIRNIERCFIALFSDNTEDKEKCKIYEFNTLQKVGSNKSSKYALIVAVGKFKYIPGASLGDAPLNDAELVRDTLQKRGYEVNILTNEKATKDNVLRTLDEIIAKIPKDGGILYFYASTHGAPKDPKGETGIVLYDTSLEKSSSCNTIDDTLSKNNDKIDKNFRDILVTAKKMCNMLSNSITLNEDIIPRLIASNKKIKFISNLDVCYSGIALKKAIENIKSDDVYTPDKNVATYLTSIYPNPMIYLSSASGEQLSMQTEFNGKQYGVFSYYFYKNLPKNSYNIDRNYNNTLKIIKETSGESCRKIKESRSGTGVKCSEEGQSPLLFKNSLIKKEEDSNL